MALDWLNRGTAGALTGLSRLGVDPTGLATGDAAPDIMLPGRLSFDPTGTRQSGLLRGGLGNLGVDPTGIRGSQRGSKDHFGLIPSYDEALGGMDAYLRRTYPDFFGPPPGASAGAPGTPAGPVGTVGGDWGNVDRWNAAIGPASASTGVPANIIKSVMKVESNGDPGARGAPGVVGLMQINTNAWGSGPWAYDDYANVQKGAEILKYYYDAYGGDWGEALRHYHGIGWDGYTTDTQYRDKVLSNLAWANASGTQPGMGFNPSGGSQFSAIWGNQGNYSVTQEYGMTDFARQNLTGMYAYTPAYSATGQNLGHIGVDVGTPVGTPLYSPVNGTIVCAATGSGNGEDSCAAYSDSSGGSGRIQIKLDNGDMLILGHTSRTNVRPGQRVAAGALVGYSGGFNGAHVHVEYRQYAPGRTRSGYLAVDPRQALGGAASFIGTPGVGGQAPGNYFGSPNELMISYMMGLTPLPWQ